MCSKNKSSFPSRVFCEIKKFAENNTVLVIALLLAVITSFVVPPDKEYLSYFDFKTLTCLFCTLAVICALKNIRFFTIIAQKIVKASRNTRMAVLTLTYITFIGSMLIANDMALLTFLPLGYYVLSSTHKEHYIAFCFIMQNISANLGGMLTPFGNPQNLYLYEKYDISNSEFIRIMLIPFIISILIMTVCCLFVKKEPLDFDTRSYKPLPKGKTVLYITMFAFSLLIVFRVVPYLSGLVLIPIILFFVDREALKRVDYGLLFTFAAFFIFAGNASRIDAVKSFFTLLLDKNVLLTSVASCQAISNVPTAILLSQFTSNYKELLIGVNIGGAGTIIASLASLITFREYTMNYPQNTKKYLLLFTFMNLVFLVPLIILSLFTVKII